MSTTVEHSEIFHFTKDSGQWWDADGPHAPLHRLNPVRIGYIRDRLTGHFHRQAPQNFRPLEGLRILDAGCGGGLVCEPLARLGAEVTGIDADAEAIRVASAHAKEQDLTIRYESTAAETLSRTEAGQFDAVLALEIVEHVRDVPLFVSTCAELCRPGGLVVFSTLNRTAKSFALGIVAAEYILGWVPKGTHRWNKFLRPSELARNARKSGLAQSDLTGMVYDPLAGAFKISGTDFDVNYFMTFTK